MAMEQDTSILKGTELFKNLSPEEIRKVLNICRPIHFSAKEIIMKEGELGDRMYVILEGTVEIIKSLIMEGIETGESDRKNKIFTRLHAKDHAVFGEIALVGEFKRTATVQAVTDCSLYEIKKSDFLTLAESDFEFGYRILRNISGIVSARLRKVDDDMMKLTTVLSMILKEA
jgi:CRP/FNR family transcriptional regulator, cyclic AMP receptor protein